MKRAPLFLSACVLLGACDCENRIRKVLSNQDSPQKRRGETLDASRRSSTPKDIEPNDKVQQATPMVLTSELRAIQGNLAQTSDIDWFALSCSCKDDEPWLLELRVEPGTKGLDPFVAFEFPDQSGFITYQTAGAGETEVVPVLAVGSKPVFVAIKAQSGSGDYAVRFKRRLTGGAIEAEPNDYISRAWPVKVPGEIQGFYDRKGDRDFLKLDVSQLDKSQLYTLQITGPKDARQIIEVFTSANTKHWLPMRIGEDGLVTEVPNLKIPKEVESIWLALSAGAFVSRKEPYRVRFVPHPRPAKNVVMEFEPNATKDQALIVTQTTAIRGYMHQGDTEDVYLIKLDTPPAPALEIEPPNKNSPSGVDVKIPTDQPKKVDGPADRPATLSLPPLAVKNRAPYLIDILFKADNPALLLNAVIDDEPVQSDRTAKQAVRVMCREPMRAAPFTVTLRPQVDASLAADKRAYSGVVRVVKSTKLMENEPNQTRAQADAVTIGKSMEGVIATKGDVDFFAIDLPEAAKSPNMFGQYVHKVNILLAKHPANLKLVIYDAEGTKVGEANKSGQGGQEQFKGVWTQGRYWVAVMSMDAPVCVPYSLKVVLEK